MPDVLKILIVDDIFINHVILESMLLEVNHEVTSVKTGLAAVEAVQKQDFDLIIMDINMPEMGGKDATRKIRELPPPKSNTPIIACSADYSIKHIKEYKDIGMNGLISKPIVKEELLLALNNCCNGRHHFPSTTDKKEMPNENTDGNSKSTTKILTSLLKENDEN